MKARYIVLTFIIVVIAVVAFLFFRSSNIYSTQAVAVEAEGNIGLAPFTDRVDFGDVPQGESVTKTVILENTGDNDNTIRIWIMGSISQMIDVEPGKTFELKANSTREIDFRFTMPASAPVGKKFTGRIIIMKLP